MDLRWESNSTLHTGGALLKPSRSTTELRVSMIRTQADNHFELIPYNCHYLDEEKLIQEKLQIKM